MGNEEAAGTQHQGTVEGIELAARSLVGLEQLVVGHGKAHGGHKAMTVGMELGHCRCRDEPYGRYQTAPHPDEHVHVVHLHQHVGNKGHTDKCHEVGNREGKAREEYALTFPQGEPPQQQGYHSTYGQREHAARYAVLQSGLPHSLLAKAQRSAPISLRKYFFSNCIFWASRKLFCRASSLSRP